MAQTNRWGRPYNPVTRDEATHAPILTPEEARQGVISGRVRLILAVSLTLVVVAFAVIFAVQA